jgi:hypothetical protein
MLPSPGETSDAGQHRLHGIINSGQLYASSAKGLYGTTGDISYLSSHERVAMNTMNATYKEYGSKPEIKAQM